MEPIDLRSDTVTRPTPGMREAMARAEVGDDVFGEDPTVNRLQDRVAELLGKECGLFFPSGTMANQACLRLHTRPGDVVVGTENCHVLRSEGGAAAALSGLQIATLGDADGFAAAALGAILPPDDPHYAPLSLVALENTHNSAGGRVQPLEQTRDIAALARERGIGLHLDGARLWNAVVASGHAAAELAAPFDTVSVCLSKGLGAPLGSVVALCADRLGALRRIRKMLGGGMRQAGVVAAAGIHALDHHRERLREDHANARFLAEGLRALGCDVDEPETNIVMFRVSEPARFVRAARDRGVWLGRFDAERLRAVTHLDVTRARLEEALGRLRELPRP